MGESNNKRHKRIGWITSITTPLVLLVIFYFIIAWKEPFPPIPSYGIELSFGLEDQGRGTLPVSSPDPIETEQETIEEVQESESQEETVEELVEEASETQTNPLTERPSPDVVEEAKKSPAETEVKDTQKAEESKSDQSKLNPEATMPSSTKEDSNDSKGESDKKGNEGKKEGTIDGRALMDAQGATTGASLDMAGWAWDSKPQPQDDSSESGKIVYTVRIDDSGYVIGLDLKSSTVSPVVERFYRQSVEKITFSQTTNVPAPPSSTGTITFIIKAR